MLLRAALRTRGNPSHPLAPLPSPAQTASRTSSEHPAGGRQLSLTLVGLLAGLWCVWCVVVPPVGAESQLPEELLFVRYLESDPAAWDQARQGFDEMLAVRTAWLETFVDAPADADPASTRVHLGRHALALDALIRALDLHQGGELRVRQRGASSPAAMVDRVASSYAAIRDHLALLSQRSGAAGLASEEMDWRTRDVFSARQRALRAMFHTTLYLRGTHLEDQRVRLLAETRAAADLAAERPAFELPATLEALDARYPDPVTAFGGRAPAPAGDSRPEPEAQSVTPPRPLAVEQPPAADHEHGAAETTKVQAQLMISGKITDSTNNPIPRIRVKIWDQDITSDDLLATVYTDNAGVYSAEATVFESPDVYLEVAEWAFELVPPSAGAYSDAHMVLVNATTTASNGGCVADPGVIQAFTGKNSPPIFNHDPSIPLVLDMAMDQSLTVLGIPLSDFPMLRDHVNDSIDYYEDKKGSVAWALSEDVPVKVRVGSGIGSFHCAGTIFIADVDIAGLPMSNGFVSDIYHEMGHLIHARLAGGTLPFAGFSGQHNVYTESDPEFAIKEGWASYVAELTDAITGVNDNKYAAYRDDGNGLMSFPPNSLWRGDEGSPPGSPFCPTCVTALDGTGFESGERIEGALCGAWFAIDDDPLFNFSDNFRALFDNNPQHIYDFARALAEDVGGPDAPKTLRMYKHMQAHGIVHNRAQFQVDPFDEQAPPDMAPPEMAPPTGGNKKLINGYTFLRGTVTTALALVPAGALGVNQIIPTPSYRIAFKPATAGLGDLPSAFTDFLPRDSAGMFELETAAIGDGDWDLLTVARNDDGFDDDMLPTWVGDNNAAVASDEAYLKTLGTWYDDDRNPANDAKAGMVLIDNTAPVVEDFKPQ